MNNNTYFERQKSEYVCRMRKINAFSVSWFSKKVYKQVKDHYTFECRNIPYHRTQCSLVSHRTHKTPEVRKHDKMTIITMYHRHI